MIRQKRKKFGVITVLVSLMLTGILSLGTLVLEAGRLQAAKTQLNEANASAGTSMIAAYDSVLYSRYGLLAIDTDVANAGRYRDYLDFNSDLYAGYQGNNISTFYTVESAEMEGMYNFTYPSVLKRQILSRAKHNIIPQDYSFNYYNMDYIISDIQRKAAHISQSLEAVATGSADLGSSADVSADITAALNNMYATFAPLKKYDEKCNVTLSSESISKLPSVTGTVEDTVYGEDIDAINNAVSDAQTVLGANGAMLASNGEATYSETDVTVDISFITEMINYLSSTDMLYSNAKTVGSDCRALIQSINAAMNVLSADKEGNLLLNSYVAGYFSNKNFTVEGYTGPVKGTAITGNMNDATFSGACTEYVFSGNANEISNQQTAYNYIIAMRLVSNLYSVITSSASFNSNNACSVAAHIAWAYYEAWTDTELLFNYNATVPYGKYNSILSINNPAEVNTAFASKNFFEAIKSLNLVVYDESLTSFIITVEGADTTNYRDALAMALWIVPNSDKLFRVADLIQLEMRYRESHVENNAATFLMSEQDTFCRVKCYAKLNSILPVISLSENGVKGTRIQSIKYLGY